MKVRCVAIKEVEKDYDGDGEEFHYSYEFVPVKNELSEEYVNLDITLENSDEYLVGCEYELSLKEL
jgi:hypothetical protein